MSTLTTRIMLEVYTAQPPFSFLAVSRHGVWMPVSQTMPTDALHAFVSRHLPNASPLGAANDNEAASALEAFPAAGGVGRAWMVEESPLVVLSSPLGFPGAVVEFTEIAFPAALTGCQSFVGHPATKQLLEALGAVTVPVPGRWNGPAIGESYLAVPLAQNARADGYTQDAAIESVSDLRAILCTRLA